MPSKKTYTVSIKKYVIPDTQERIIDEIYRTIDSSYSLTLSQKGNLVFNNAQGHIHFSVDYETASNWSNVMGSGKSSYVSFSDISLSGARGELIETYTQNVYDVIEKTTYLPPLQKQINHEDTITITLQYSKSRNERYKYQESGETPNGYTSVSVVGYKYDVSGTAYSWNIGCHPQGITTNNVTFTSIIKYGLSGAAAVLNANAITLTIRDNNYQANSINVSYPDTMICKLEAWNISHD